MDAVRQTLRMPTCARRFPRDIGKSRPCLNAHLGKCVAVCGGKVSKEDYAEMVDACDMLLGGKFDDLAADIRAGMERASENMEYERAARLRDRLRAVESLGEKQEIARQGKKSADIAGYYSNGQKACAVMLNITDGVLCGKDFVTLRDAAPEDMPALLGEYIKMYYSTIEVYPVAVYLPCKLEDMDGIEDFLSRKAGRGVRLSAPSGGAYKDLLKMAGLNAREELERSTSGEERQNAALAALKTALGLDSLPVRIEAFDVSNTGGGENVGSMIVYENGRPLKRAYRRFKIKDVEGQDDYHSMAEMVMRRVARFTGGDPHFSPLPGLMLIDGGQTHAAAVKSVLAGSADHIPVFGMVKDDRHRTRGLISVDGREVTLETNPLLFSFIGKIQEEAHRFAVEYHRSLRSKKLVGSELDQIPGVGKERKKLLLRAFGSMAAVKRASLEEIKTLPRMPVSCALAVYNYFHEQKAQDHENTNAEKDNEA